MSALQTKKRAIRAQNERLKRGEELLRAAKQELLALKTDMRARGLLLDDGDEVALLEGQPLQAGQYVLRARKTGEERWDLYVDGVPVRSWLSRSELLRVAALLREAFTFGRFR